MQVRERNGVRAIVEVEQQAVDACRVSMMVEHGGHPLWSERRDVRLADSDRVAFERMAIDAVSAIADHLIRRHRLAASR
jgi:hypothetical protein